jgi:hypothetical protein
MWMYPGPSHPDRSFSIELDNAEIDAWNQGILVHGVNRNSGPSPIPLREGAISPWVSPLKLILI